MLKNVRVLGAVFVLGLAAACQPQQAEEVTVDTEAIRAAIESENNKWNQAWLAGDGAALAGLYTEDAILAMPNTPRVSGRDAIAAAYDATLSSVSPTTSEITLDHLDIAKSGEVAYAVGTYSGTSSLPDGTSVADTAGQHADSTRAPCERGPRLLVKAARDSPQGHSAMTAARNSAGRPRASKASIPSSVKVNLESGSPSCLSCRRTSAQRPSFAIASVRASRTSR